MELYNINEMINKPVTFRKKQYTIDSYLISKDAHQVEKLLFKLKLVKGSADTTHYIPTTFFDTQEATTKDDQLLEYVAKCNKDYAIALGEAFKKEAKKQEELRVAKAKQEEEERKKKQLYLEQQVKQGSERGREDARSKISLLYKIFTSHNYKDISKAENYSKAFRDNYIISYDDEKKLMKQEKLVASRSKYDTLDSYPGDLDELIAWMRNNCLRIDVFASPDKLGNEQSAIDVINERDGTDYKVKIRQGQYVAYEAFFKNPTTAPQEFLSWLVSKHDYTTSDLNQRVMAHPMNVETGKMTCNSLVKELVYNSEYAFNVGKYIRKKSN